MSTVRGILVLNHLSQSAGGAIRSMRELVDEAAHLGVRFQIVAFRKGRARYLIQLAGLARSILSADFLLFNSSASVVQADPRPVMWLCWLFRCPVFVYVRECAYQYQNKYSVDQDNVRAKRLSRVYLSRWVGFLFVSEFARRCFVACFASPVRAAVVGNGVRVQAYLRILERGDQAPELPLVINIGTLQERKGYRFFIEIAERVCRDNPDALFVWFGDGPDLDVARSLVEKTGFGERIVFPGHSDDPIPLLWLAKVALVTSEEESFSRVAAESLALGTKLVVCKGVGGPEEIAGPFALRVDRTDAADAARVVGKILTMPMSRNDRARRRQHFEENFSIEVHAARFVRTLRSLLRA